jgi:AcrR family transcriptional regulator
MDNAPAKSEGLRERKRRETLHRIAEAGLRLFIADGYEATTLDAIAAAAGISRRTFFYYFKSKEEILLAWQSGTGEILRAALLEEPPDQTPFDAVRNAMLRVSARYASDEIVVIDQLMRSTETLRARKQASYLQQEQALFAALCERWPQPEHRSSLRLVAMAAIGALRLAFEAWGEDGGKLPLTNYLRDAFTCLKDATAAETSRPNSSMA